MTQKSRERLNLVSIMDDSTGPRQHGTLRRQRVAGASSPKRAAILHLATMSLGLTEHRKEDREQRLAEIREALGSRSIVLIGLMGAGKTAVGRRLASRLDLPFIDADAEIEEAAGSNISEIFAEHGEAYFRQGERKVIARLLRNGPQVLATGGGAYMNAETRANIKAHGISVWLRAELKVLLKRVNRRDNRPLLAGDDHEAVMKKLMAERYPIYAEADVTVESRDVPHDTIVGAVVDALADKLGCAKKPAKDQSRKKV
ncbi:MAG TPA: shikimate kinase [Methyloceanibacter sp.]